MHQDNISGSRWQENGRKTNNKRNNTEDSPIWELAVQNQIEVEAR